MAWCGVLGVMCWELGSLCYSNVEFGWRGG